jgi:hypothetical protein
VSSNSVDKWIANRYGTLASIVVIVPVGFYSKLYRGPGAHWVNDSLGGVFYVIFWCLVAFLVWPGRRPSIVASLVLAVTCGLEFLQLWHPALLEALRSHFLGAAVLGTTFTWTDFPYYFAGAALGWIWLKRLAGGLHDKPPEPVIEGSDRGAVEPAARQKARR